MSEIDQSNISLEEIIQSESITKQMNQDSQQSLYLTNTMITFGDISYPVRNISSVEVKPNKVITSITEKWIGWKIALIIFIIGVIIIFMADTKGPLIIILILLIFATILKTEKIPSITTYYSVQLETNAGKQDLLFSQDKEFMEKIHTSVYKILSNQSSNIQYTINIADKQIIDNSTNIQNETNNYTTNFNIEVKQEGISKEDLAFIYGDFKKALEDLDTKLEKVQDNTAREQLQAIVNEVNSEDPNPSKIKKIWKKVEDICAGYDTLSSVSDIGETILKVASIFFIST